jgi:Ca2+-binding RTX toxin-like protein
MYFSARRFFVLGVLMLLLVSVVTGLTAANAVPASKAADRRQNITTQALAPSQCGGLGLTTVVDGAGLFAGTNANELITGSAGGDIILGAGGNDCILGGGGDDAFIGGNGTDVCIGGPGNDTFFFGGCEVQIQ